MSAPPSTIGQRALRAVPRGVIAATMLLGGISHLAAPDQFVPLVPRSLPAHAVLYATGALQCLIGVAVLFPGTRRLAGLAFALLCLGYLPLHLWDFVRPDPVFAPPTAASIRVAVQLVLISVGMTVWRRRS